MMSELLPEPPNGAMVVLRNAEGERKLIWRDDDASDFGISGDERWYDDLHWSTGDPREWVDITRDATVIHLVSGEPAWVES
jgi:hypothetical protein